MTTDTASWLVGKAEGPAADSAPTEPRHRLGAAGRVHLLAGIVLGAELVYLATVVSRAYFYGDDFVELYSARTLGPSVKLFEYSGLGDFTPGYNFVNYLIAGVPYHWLPIALFEICFLALTLGVFYGLLSWLFGPRPTNVLLVALAGASFTLIPSIIWWASGLQQVVSIPACLLAIWEHLRYLRDGRLRHAVGATAAIAVGLAFYDGTLVIAVFLVALTALSRAQRAWCEGFGMGTCENLAGVAALRRPHRLRPWLAFHALFPLRAPPPPTIGALAQFVGLGWAQSLVPETVLGVLVWSLAGHGQRVAVDLLAQLVVVVLVVTSVWRDRKAWRPWVVFAVTFVTGAIPGWSNPCARLRAGPRLRPALFGPSTSFSGCCVLAWRSTLRAFADTWLRRPYGEPHTAPPAGLRPATPRAAQFCRAAYGR